VSAQTLTAPQRAAPAGSPDPVPAVSALDLARRIEIPQRLPVTYKGEPLRCLSDSSISRYLTCPDDWRRHYLLGERAAPSGSMFLGSRLDEVQTIYYKAMLSGGGPPDREQLRDCFRDAWKRALKDERADRGSVRWDEGTDQRWTFNVGLDAIDVFLKRIAGKLGKPLAVQRQFEFRLAPGIQWTVTGRVDLDTARRVREFINDAGEVVAVAELADPRPKLKVLWRYAPDDLRSPLRKASEQDTDAEAAVYQPPVDVPLARVPGSAVEREVVGVTDNKAKNGPIYEYQADQESQPSLYCLERDLIGRIRVYDFTYAQLLKPKEGKRKQVSAKIVRTRRSRDQHQGFLALIAMVAAQINGAYTLWGPDRPWGFAAPGSWKCRVNSKGTDGLYCPHWRTCPRGIGLGSRS
jgi:hypothetical protein